MAPQCEQVQVRRPMQNSAMPATLSRPSLKLLRVGTSACM